MTKTRFCRGAWCSVLGTALFWGAPTLSNARVIRWPAHPGEPQKIQFIAATAPAGSPAQTLTIDVLTDLLFHFEITHASSAHRDGTIITTPLVQRTDYAGASGYQTSANGFTTSAVQVTVDAKTLCMKVIDLKQNSSLTEVCPSANNSITLTPEKMQNVYGLGEQFRNLGESNGDWNGTTRTPGWKYGNAIVAFGGGATGNVQIPVMYALGPDHLNYGLYLDDVYALSWDFSKAQSGLWTVTHPPIYADNVPNNEVPSPAKAFRGYFIAGKDLPELRTQYMDLTGHAPVPPKKAFGLWVSEFGYRNWGEVDDHLKTLRRNHFPVDGFVLDLYWYGGYQSNSVNSQMGIYDWDQVNFPNAAQKIAKYDQDSGIGLMLIEESYISQADKNFSLMADQGFLAKEKTSDGSPAMMSSWWGTGGMVDWSNDQGTSYWADRMRKPLTDAGVVFHWCDLGEPESFLPDNWYKGYSGFGNGEAESHNLYSFKWVQSIADGYTRNGESKRHYTMSRSGAAGMQRFGAGMWSGDIGSNMRSLSSHLNVQMQMALSGIDYFGADIGGFHREALEGNIDDVYTRWFAHASWFDMPVRPHTDDGSKKNFTAPDRIGDMKSNLFNIRQRYELAPYYYSVAHEAYLTGQAFIPPLVYYFQEDPNVRIIAEEKMVGPSLLVASSAKNDETNRGIYLPKGDWVNYHTNAWYHSNGQWFADFPLSVDGIFSLPVVARAGAIIPKSQIDDSTMNMLGKRSDGSVDTLFNVRVYANQAASTFNVFEDDGVTEAYKSGAVMTTLVSQQDAPGGQNGQAEVTIAPSQGTYSGAPSSRTYEVEWIGENRAIQGVQVNGTQLDLVYSRSDLDDAAQGWYFDGQVVYAKVSDLSGASVKQFKFTY